MRTIGNTRQLAARQEKALHLLTQGHATAAVASSVGVSQRSIQRWQHEANTSRRRRRAKAMGRPPRLLAKQIIRLRTALIRGAFSHGYAEDYWTLDGSA